MGTIKEKINFMLEQEQELDKKDRSTEKAERGIV